MEFLGHVLSTWALTLLALTPVFYLFIWIWSLFDCSRRVEPSGEKLMWVLTIFFGQIIGIVLYLAMRRPRNAPLF